MTAIIAIDPGGITTGIVALWAGKDEPATVSNSWAINGSIGSYLHWWDETREYLDETVIVCEQFVQRNIAGADLSPLRLQGAIEALAYERGFDLHLQPASGKNTAVTDTAMLTAGFTKDLFKGDHHQDRWEALRHGLWYLKRHKHMPTLNAMYPR